ncbi:hypothetical protein BJY22_007004 [Kribbella shirazensis]|uniref:IrrE N-terminal-like domain-containing protein n=2 Tax=Kribbella shirazensis TaxID=1105143 RepID=A0A7X5VHH9_9ACTN|nr:hypothetical protein [Kribbella shirazensis]
MADAAFSLAHELSHLWMHKRSRDSGCHGLTRLEADSAAYTLLARFGCLPIAPSPALITSATAVIGRKPPSRLVETLGGRVVASASRLISATAEYLPTSAGTGRDLTGRSFGVSEPTAIGFEMESARPEPGL